MTAVPHKESIVDLLDVVRTGRVVARRTLTRNGVEWSAPGMGERRRRMLTEAFDRGLVTWRVLGVDRGPMVQVSLTFLGHRLLSPVSGRGKETR